jgi:hypothetical protein
VIRRDGTAPNKKEAATITPLSSLYVAVEYYVTLIHAADQCAENAGIKKEAAEDNSPILHKDDSIHAADQRAENAGIKKEAAEDNSPILHKDDSSNADMSHRSDKLPNKKVAAIDEIVFDTPIIFVDGCHASAISPRDEKSQNKDEFAEKNSSSNADLS